MKSFSIKLELQRALNREIAGFDESSDADFLRFKSAGLSLEVARTPEVGWCSSFKSGPSSGLMLVLGSALYNGERFSEETVQSFLRAWRQNRNEVLNRLDGSFLIIVHDSDSGETGLISDPCGTRPVWYAESDKGICFSSEPKFVAEIAGLPVEPDPAWLWSMLHYRRTVGERSSVKGVRGMPSGTVLSWNGSEAAFTTWFDYALVPDAGKAPSAFGNDFLELVKSTITGICDKSESPSLLLSGGLDSRLLAAVSPQHVQCLTVCDSINREVVLAQRVAKTADLSHRVVLRPEDWYPNLVEESCRLGGGVWLWDQAHFLPLEEHGFDHDATLVGYGSDTFFKGKDIDWDPLWHGLHGASTDEMVSRCLELLGSQPSKIKDGIQLLHPDYAEVCRNEFMLESRRELADAVNYCSLLPDVWQMFWSRNLARATALMNLVSLRGFTLESNVFTTVSMRRFYQTLPAELRRSGQLPILALHAGGYRELLAIPDANTWLPYTYPPALHRLSAKARRTIAGLRKQRRAGARNANYKSNCSWPHNGRFWLSSPSMSGLMDGFVDGDVFNGSRFDHPKVQQIWKEHIGGVTDHSSALDFLVTYGCVFS